MALERRLALACLADGSAGSFLMIPEQIDRETAVCFLECFFQAIFAQPARYQDCEARSVRPEHVMGSVIFAVHR